MQWQEVVDKLKTDPCWLDSAQAKEIVLATIVEQAEKVASLERQFEDALDCLARFLGYSKKGGIKF